MSSRPLTTCIQDSNDYFSQFLSCFAWRSSTSAEGKEPVGSLHNVTTVPCRSLSLKQLRRIICKDLQLPEKGLDGTEDKDFFKSAVDEVRARRDFFWAASRWKNTWKPLVCPPCSSSHHPQRQNLCHQF